jgi:hypothetical protein
MRKILNTFFSGKGDDMIKMADIDEAMSSCDLEVLNPGGVEKTDEMARKCKAD